MKTIKVLVLTTSFPLAQGSVSGLFVKRLVDNFPPDIHPVVVVPCDKNEMPINQLSYKVKCFNYAPRNIQVLAHLPGGIPAALNSGKFALLLVPFFLIAMFAKCLIEAKDVDLIHANWSVSGVIGGVVGFLYSKPVITTFRGEDVNKAEKNMIYNLVLKLAIKFSTHIVCVSLNMVEKVKLISANKNYNIKFIPNGVDKYLAETANDFHQKKENKLIIVTVGSLTENKNTILIIEAVNKLIKKGKDITLNIIGDGPQKTALESIIKKYQLQNHIHMHGSLESKDVYEIVRRSDMFVLSSFREGRPNVILESMVLGTLVLASRIEGVMEIIENKVSGLLFDPYNCDDLTECINMIIDNYELYDELSRNAQKYIVSNKLFWDETANQYIELYKTVIAR